MPIEWREWGVEPFTAEDTNEQQCWPPGLAELVSWFKANRDRLSSEPYCLGPGRSVSHPTKFYSSLDRDKLAGPSSTRARYGLASDLRDLRFMVEEGPGE